MVDHDTRDHERQQDYGGVEISYDAEISLPLIIERVVVNHGSQPAGKSGGVAAFSKRGATGEHIL